MEKGKIGVTTENIFPIIKQFLYTDNEIFLRELVSNAIDATQKLKILSTSGQFSGDLGDLSIKVDLDTDAKTLTISDHGIGMTKEEVDQYINQIAFSSAEEFLEKYKNKENAIIGHFGLGFYSAFMVSKKVEIITKSYKDKAPAVHWSCDGTPEYTLEETDKRTERGTDIILHLDDEFVDENRIRTLLTKYCRFLPIPIAFGFEKEWKDNKEVETDKPNIINITNPLWKQKPADLKDEDYKNFYRDLYPMNEEPIFHIHLNVDYPFNLTGILYFPKLKETIEIQKNKIQLYSNQVFVTDSVEQIVPDFLTLLHGVIDSPDIPLNVSRSSLQSDSNVKKISAHITKKVADKLESIFKKDRKNFEEKWDDLKLFLYYGMITEEKFYDKVSKFTLFKTTDGKFYTLEEYKKLIEANQTDKNKNLVILYTTDKDSQYSYIETAKAKGYSVIEMTGQLDVHLINHLETKDSTIKYTRVDADVIEKLIEKEDQTGTKLDTKEQDDLTQIFQAVTEQYSKGHFLVTYNDGGKDTLPIVITQSEFMRRMKDMAKIGGGGMNFYGDLPDSYNLVINPEHPLIKKLIKDKTKSLNEILQPIEKEIETITKEKEALDKKLNDKKEEEISSKEKDEKEALEKKLTEVKQQKEKHLKQFANDEKLVSELVDLAMLSQNMLKGEHLDAFIKRSVSLLK